MNWLSSGLAKLEKWQKAGWLSHLDIAFTRFLWSQAPDSHECVLSTGALVSQQLRLGKVYLDLNDLWTRPEKLYNFAYEDNDQLDVSEALTELADLKTSDLEFWKKELRESTLVGLGEGNTPLVLDGNRVYLRRYWQYQQSINTAIHQRLSPTRENLPNALQDQIDLLFAPACPEKPDWQKIACVLALRGGFAIITGGPGTGKTTTLTKLLALLVSLNNPRCKTQKLRILLTAPTGKAAARVSEALNSHLKNLNIADDIKALIPQKASTLHTILGIRRQTRRYVHHKHNPISADVIIVDEASMIDLELMAALVDALSDSAQLILLGDKDQLASVEAGAVMGELCQGAENLGYDAQTREWIKLYAGEALEESKTVGTAVNQQTVQLRYSYRFAEHSGIGLLAKAVNAGDPLSAQAVLNDTTQQQDLSRLRLNHRENDDFKQLITWRDSQPSDTFNVSKQSYGHYLNVIAQYRPQDKSHYDDWASQVLEAFDAFRVLCALRTGPWGSESLNRKIEDWLFSKGKQSLWYEGRPVMVTRNDYQLGLMNGAIGIALYDESGHMRVAFPGNTNHESGKIFWVSPMRLAEVETAFAMTVHKAQGSEFEHVALVLPETRSPILTKELIYTGISRAKNHFTLVESNPDIFNHAVLSSCR